MYILINLEGDLFRSHCTTPSGTIETFEPEDDNDTTLFDQYLRPPSPSPPLSPDDAASDLKR